MPATKQTRVIIVKAQVQGDKQFRQLAKQLGAINKNTDTLKKSFGGLRNVFAAGLFGLGLRDIIKSVDSFQLLEDRIKVFTGNAEDAAVVFDGLRKAARFTRTSIDGLAQAYNRIALATQELGLNQNQILATTLALQQTFRLSGATIAEATGATIQLAQGLSSGQLRGQELRSVLESNAVFANILSKELGITRGQLIKFAESGRITNEKVLNALRDNFDKLNEDAQKLGTTFSQTLTISLDAFRFKLAKLNKEFGINSLFEKAILGAIDNIDTLAVTIAAFVASRTVINLAIGFQGLGFALKGLSAFLSGPNPIIIGLTALIAASQFLSKNLKETFDPSDVGKRIEKISKGIEAQKKIIDGAQSSVKGGGFLNEFFGGQKLENAQANLKKLQDELGKLLDLQRRGFTKIPGQQTLDEFIEQLRKSIKSINTTGVTTVTGVFGDLNRRLRIGAISLNTYRSELDKIRLDELNDKFKQGKITIDQYTDAFLKLNTQVQKLSLADQALTGLKAGLSDVVLGVGNLATQVRSTVNGVFNQLEDQILNFVKTGKFAFKDFATFVIDELTRIAIKQAVIAPLAGSLFSGLGASSASAGNTFSNANITPSSGGLSANGNVFSGNITPFANGGIVDGPTLFPMSAGRTGLMGEAGSEAIIPLERGANGKLGVNASGSNGVVVNVNNYTEGNVEVQESKTETGERQLDIIVTRTVTKAIGEGRFDRQFSQTYGLQRRGS